MRLSFDQAGELLDELAEPFPEALFDGLNGGVNLLEDAVPDPEFPAGEMYVLGEYREDLLGRYINLYYGSFAALAEREDWTEEDWRTDPPYGKPQRSPRPGRQGRGGAGRLAGGVRTGRRVDEKTRAPVAWNQNFLKLRKTGRMVLPVFCRYFVGKPNWSRMSNRKRRKLSG